MPGEMMNAVRIHRFGGPEVLVYEAVPRPRPGPGEVLVRVRAVGLNPPDWYLRDGYRSLPPAWRPAGGFPIIPGTDVSGVVAGLGRGVDDVAIGDAVYALIRFPEGVFGGSNGYAEYVSVPAAHLAPAPAGIGHVQAAAAPMSLLTAWQFLVDPGHDVPNPLQPARHQPVPLDGRRVLINGAAGGVGHFALQIAKLKGAQVIAVASARHKALLHDLGADQVIDYRETRPEDVVRDLDLVVDAVGGPATGRFLKTLKPGGALFPIFPLGFDGAAEATRQGVVVSATQVRSSGAQLRQLAPLLSDGRIRPVIDGTWPLAEARRAHERAGAGHIQGKIVLTVD
ncbi:NADPH:quinone reductase [Tistrella mobilis]|uniref:NADPH:quinone reductase n=2 Tax=Tistrella mobilis TaxID=171437 RepID=A0A162JVU2_9PROT|nr:NADPH:quinone reductase [Tistrella mobilis]